MTEKLPFRFGAARLTLAVAAAALAISGCGDDDDEAGGASSKPQRLGITVAEQGKNKFAVSAPKSVKAGIVEISLSTTGSPRTMHDAQLVRVDGNHTVDEVLKFIAAGEGAPTPRWLFAAGGVGQTRGGETSAVTQQLTPGRYFILDTGEPEGENVKSYAETGATAQLEVTRGAGGGELPKTDSKVTAKDYTFTASGLKPGRNRIEFDNAGKELHHLIAFPYRKGTTLADVKKAFREQEEEASGPPPVDFEGGAGTAVLEGGMKQVAELELKHGKYALVCFISDRKGGPPHVAKGMVAEAAVR